MTSISEEAKSGLSEIRRQITKSSVESMVSGVAQIMTSICMLQGIMEMLTPEGKQEAYEGICDITNELYDNLTSIRKKVRYKEDTK